MATVRVRTRAVCTGCGTHYRGLPTEVLLAITLRRKRVYEWNSQVLCGSCKQAHYDFWHYGSASPLTNAAQPG